MVNKQSRLSSPEPAALNIGNGRAELGEIVVFIEGHTETSRILERRHASPGARRAPSQRVHAAGARNYPAGDVRPRQGHRERDRGALGATPRDRGRLRAQFEDIVRRITGHSITWMSRRERFRTDRSTNVLL